MAKTDYSKVGSERAEQLLKELFELGQVGYVALGVGQHVLLRAAPDLATETSAETNFYEELLVNPTLLKLAGQRAGLDCGGLRYMAIGYGSFVQLIMPMKHGHVSLGVSRKAPVPELAARVQAVLDRHALTDTPPEAWLEAASSG